MSKPIEIKHSKNEQIFNAIESGVGYSEVAPLIWTTKPDS